MKVDPASSPLAGSPASAPIPGQVAGQSVYGQASYNSGVHYATDDPVLPVDDGGIVKSGTGGLSDTVFLNFLMSENEAMTANPNYTAPNPSVAAMGAAISDLQEKIVAMTNAKTIAKEATNARDVSRITAEGLYKTRASYVQLTSNGNTGLNLNAGFPVRSSPSPVGVLPPPLNLRVDLNGTIGKMIVTWNSVAKSRGYLLECAELAEGSARVEAHRGGRQADADPKWPDSGCDLRLPRGGGGRQRWPQ